MTELQPFKNIPWKRSRYGFAALVALSLLAAWSVLRLILLVKFSSLHAMGGLTAARVFFTGFQADLFVALMSVLPLLFWLWLIGNGAFVRTWHRVLFVGASFLFWTLEVFLCFTEYFFFEEFKSRFNTVAVDYLHDRSEVFGNIRDSYPVGAVVVICCALSLIWVVLAFRYFRPMWTQPVSGRSRFLHLAAALALCAALAPALNLSGPHFSSDRTVNEIANNGSVAFVAAAWTRNLEYAAYYRTLPLDEAYRRTRKLLASPKAVFEDTSGIRRQIAGDPARPKLNVIILVEESLGSEFWGSLGRKGVSLTPCMDELGTEEGLLFTNIYACGNRTVRGFEGALSSFPPLPGDSIVKRDRSENIESIARVLKRDGYNTLFLYGGRGAFDSMRSYALRNGWDRFLEHNPPFHDDFPHAQFATIWGVCDHEVFARAIDEFRALNEAGKPFLGTVMSVSNHKPFTYPRGCIPEDPDKPRRTREKAVKYSDWSLGQFFQMARKERFWTNTVFVVVADHGARVYGSQDIPIFSYEIPMVVLGPAVVKTPERIGTLGNSLDVSPTILGLIGRPYESLFFGRDLMTDLPEDARAVLNHNRDIGMYAGGRMVVLGLPKTARFYEGDPKVAELTPVAQAGAGFLELEKNATAIYQVADDLYMHREYRIDGMPAQARPMKQEVAGHAP